MELYLAYKDNGFLKEHKTDTFGSIYYGRAINNIKVVACPFCGVSTSNGEMVRAYKGGYVILFGCTTCRKMAFATERTKLVTKEEVERLYPHQDYDDVVFHLVELHDSDPCWGFSTDELIMAVNTLIMS